MQSALKKSEQSHERAPSCRRLYPPLVAACGFSHGTSAPATSATEVQGVASSPGLQCPVVNVPRCPAREAKCRLRVFTGTPLARYLMDFSDRLKQQSKNGLSQIDSQLLEGECEIHAPHSSRQTDPSQGLGARILACLQRQLKCQDQCCWCRSWRPICCHSLGRSGSSG